MDTIYNPDDFWSRVKDLLKKQNITQLELEKRIDLTECTIKQQIFHHRIPDAIEAQNIAEELHTTVEYLITGNESDLKIKTDKLIKDILQSINSYQE